MLAPPATAPPRIIGRYEIHEALASGGMATVHLGRLRGPVGFSRTVAIKRLHPHYASDPECVSMLLDEARLVARIRHPNVVPTLDVVSTDGELFIVMEYVHGESLSRLFKELVAKGERIPSRIAASILRDVLQGLHSAHDARDEQGEPLGIVHRDVSPQNIILGADGVARVLDFGVAKAAGRSQVTREGQLKGKLAYMAPEQLTGAAVTRVTDVFAAAIVLWELLTGTRLFSGDSEGVVVTKVLQGKLVPPSKVVPALGDRFDALVMKGLARDPAARFPSAREMAQALAKVEDLADAAEIGEWLEHFAHPTLLQRAQRVADVESGPSVSAAAASRADRAEAETLTAPGLPEHGGVKRVDGDATATELSRDELEVRLPRRRWPFVGAGAAVLLGLGVTLYALGKADRPPPPPASQPMGVSSVASPPPAPPSSSPSPPIPEAPTSAAHAATSAIVPVAPRSRPPSPGHAPPRTPRSPTSPPRATADSIPEHL